MKMEFRSVMVGFILCALAPMAAMGEANAPALVVNESEYRFENVFEGETVKHDFILYNRGGADLHIEKIKTG
jgi:hypothetical protein